MCVPEYYWNKMKNLNWKQQYLIMHYSFNDKFVLIDHFD